MTQSIDLASLPHQRLDAERSKGQNYVLSGHVLYSSGQASPGDNVFEAQVPHGTYIVSASVTETRSDGSPWFGDARFSTQSVQLRTDENMLRVAFNLQWHQTLPYCVMVILGTRG
jgi:hypothetical protein